MVGTIPASAIAEDTGVGHPEQESLIDLGLILVIRQQETSLGEPDPSLEFARTIVIAKIYIAGRTPKVT